MTFFHKTAIFTFLVCNLWAQGVSYVRYYRTEQDFIRGISMSAIDRRGLAHLRVLYDREHRILSKGKIDAGGILLDEEVFLYDNRGNLTRRSIRDGNGRVESLFVYGDEEPMSRAFIDYVYPDRNPKEFQDRVTVYRYGPGQTVLSYRFLSVDGFQWGSIEYDYFESGLVREERWMKGPDRKTVRLFEYRYDPDTRTYALSEYDSTGTPVSRVAVVLPGEQRLTAEELLRRRHPEFEEELTGSTDLVYMKDGDTLRVDILHISDTVVRFRMFGEEDTLSMTLDKVGEIERRDGKILYPKLY